MIALTKCLDPERDYVELAPELELVDAVGIGEQHNHRRFEYSLALRALRRWQDARHKEPCNIYDVGGAGSPFRYMVQATFVVDPKEYESYTLEQFACASTELADAVFCLSTIEHVDDLQRFLYHLSCLVAPGGLLFLTTDCWDGKGADTAHFHWDRKRIFSMEDWRFIRLSPHFLEFSPFGDTDWTYHGHQLFASYSFCSVALIKRA
jgi:SAM-dependent methyltransferase